MYNIGQIVGKNLFLLTLPGGYEGSKNLIPVNLNKRLNLGPADNSLDTRRMCAKLI
jgi:hypothetical protein